MGRIAEKLDQVLTDWEKAVETADDQKLAANASVITHVATHNAYRPWPDTLRSQA